MNRKITLLAAGIPVTLLILSIITFVINTRIAEGKPRINEITPSIARRGEELLIKGRNFGDSRESSRVYISSLDILSRYILSWNDEEIAITVPEKAESGLLSIKTDRGMSKPVVIVLENSVPAIGAGSYIPGFPFIEYIDPPSAKAGDVVTITGENFGNRKDGSNILFSSRFSRETELLDGEAGLLDFLKVSDEAVLNWTDKLVRFYLPDNVETGDVFLQTEKGHSNAAYFEQELSKGRIDLGEKKTYMINQSVSFSAESSGPKGKIYYWFVSPEETLFQRNPVTLPDRFFPSRHSCPGLTLYTIDDFEEAVEAEINQNVIIDVYTRTYTPDFSELEDKYDRDSYIYRKYTDSNEIINASAPRITSVARSVTRRKNNTYDKARSIYDYVIARLTASENAEEWSPEIVIDSLTGDSKAYSLLFSALARSSGIPARPVTGLLVDDEMEVSTHWWAEYYIQGFGWFPVDPYLADLSEENLIENYWGNIDNLHIAFSRGMKDIPLLFPDGSAVNDIDYVFLSHDREINSAINNLHLNWSNVKITSIY